MIEGGFVILDFGSQVTQLIARRFRELGYYSEILPYQASMDTIQKLAPKGIILSGGPSSVSEPGAPVRDVKELLECAPVLGICYGMQLLAHQLGGKVVSATEREYGDMVVQWSKPISDEIPVRQKVWMSHGDIVEAPPPGWEIVATSTTGHAAAMMGNRGWAFQFHPEVSHTEHGMDLLGEFARFSKAQKSWSTNLITDHLISDIKSKVKPGERIICALSGGVDSSVVATLLTRALSPEAVSCIFVDNGLLRLGEFDQVLSDYKAIGLNVKGVDASDIFLKALDGIEDPEQKRKTIGRVFIDVFTNAVKDEGEFTWLAQGTLYPDVIESVSPRGASVTIKSHHNVGGLPEKLHLKLLEPLRELFKDEVRLIGKKLGLPTHILQRHPFPGPGLAIRVLGAVNREDLDVLRKCDQIFISELKRCGLYDEIWQAFCVLLPVKSVGVQGDNRTYDRVLALRAITSNDGMTADWYAFEPAFLRSVSNLITNRVTGVNRVVYDVTSKPPGTIEWE